MLDKSDKTPEKTADKKLVEISFDPKVVFCGDESAVIYGIKVELKGEKLVGLCEPSIKKDLLDAGRCDK